MSKSAPSNSRAIGSAAKGSGQFAMLLLSMCAFALYFIFNYSAYNLRRYVIINSAGWYTKSARIKNNDNAHGDNDDDIMFDGSSDFLTLLRKAHAEKLSNPQPHCTTSQSNNSNSNDNPIRPYNRAIEIDFIGRSGLKPVLTTSSNYSESSCHFTALSFPPTTSTLHSALQSPTYITSAFHTLGQCYGSAFNWNVETQYTCLGNNWYGTLGPGTTKEHCIEESLGGYPIKQWLDHNNNYIDNNLNSGNVGSSGSGKAIQCLKLFLQEEDILQNIQKFDDINTLTNTVNRTEFIRESAITMGGYNNNNMKDWNTNVFVRWSRAVLLVLAATSSTDSSNGSANVDSVITQLDNILKAADGNSTKKSSLAQCVDKLIPPSHPDDDTLAATAESENKAHTQHYWKEKGLYMKTSTMEDSPTTLLRSFNASLAGVLPPPPTAVYATNAILHSLVVNAPLETYIPGCTPYWNALFQQKELRNGPQKNIHLCSSSNSTATSTATAVTKSSVGSNSSNNTTSCPYPTYDLVIDVSQVYCIGFFHFTIEVWPRIAPFLDALLANDMQPFAIRLGCGALTDFHYGFYDLMGLDLNSSNSSKSKVTLIGEETVHAREVIVPTEGFSHSPYLNYWNLVALRKHVRRRILGDATDSSNSIKASSSINQQQKIVMVIVRDASRRGDANIYNDNFFATLSKGLGSTYNVTDFRSSDASMMKCLTCQARAFMNADVIIGSHGAGLSHTMFAKKGGILLERIVGDGDSRIYAELAFLNQIKYFAMQNDTGAQAYVDVILFANSFS